MKNKLEELTLSIPCELSRKPREDIVRYLQRVTVYMNEAIVGLKGGYEETLR